MKNACGQGVSMHEESSRVSPRAEARPSRHSSVQTKIIRIFVMLFIVFSNLLSVFKQHIMDILRSQSIETKFNHFNGCLVFNGMDMP